MCIMKFMASMPYPGDDWLVLRCHSSPAYPHYSKLGLGGKRQRSRPSPLTQTIEWLNTLICPRDTSRLLSSVVASPDSRQHICCPPRTNERTFSTKTGPSNMRFTSLKRCVCFPPFLFFCYVGRLIIPLLFFGFRNPPRASLSRTLDQADGLGMDSHSVSLTPPGEKEEWRVDVPMRSFQGGKCSPRLSTSFVLTIEW